MSDLPTVLTRMPGDGYPRMPGDHYPTMSGDRDPPVSDALLTPSPSVFTSDAPNGARTIRYGTGAAGLAMFGARARRQADRDAFRMSLEVARFGVLDVCHGRHTAMIAPRMGNNFGHSRRTVRLLILLAGEVTLSVEGSSFRLGPGSGAITRGWDKYVYESRPPVARVHVDIPADVPPFAAALRDVTPAAWSAESPVLYSAGAALVEMIRRERGTQEPGARDGLRRMAEAVTLSVLATPPSIGGEPPATARQRARALSYIAAHHAEPDLNAATLAAHLGLSTRSLQRVFAGEERGVAEEITAARLLHTLALLRDPLLREASLEEIAVRSGFGAVARMRRAVKAATGLCPREYREQPGNIESCDPGGPGLR